MNDIIQFDYARTHIDSSFEYESSYMTFDAVNHELIAFEHSFYLSNPLFRNIGYSM